MQKAFGLLIAVLAIWAAIEIYTKGTQHAFGGLLTRVGVVEPAESEATSAAERAGSRFEDAYQKQLDRVEEQVNE